jgi:hypothetical protein
MVRMTGIAFHTDCKATVKTAFLGNILTDIFMAIGTQPGSHLFIELDMAVVARCFQSGVLVDEITRHDQNVVCLCLQGEDKNQAR